MYEHLVKFTLSFFCRNESTPSLVDYEVFTFMQYEKGIINETVYIYIEYIFQILSLQTPN